MDQALLRLGLDFNPQTTGSSRFIAGSMFWFRRAALRSLDLGPSEGDVR